MAAVLRLRQIEFRAAQHHLALVGDVIFYDIQKPQLLGFPVRDGDHVDAERAFEIGVLIERGEDLVHVRVLFHPHDGAHAVAVGFVGNFADAAQNLFFLFAKVCDLRQKARLIDLIGKFRDDDEFFIVFALLHGDFGTHGDLAAPRFVRL